MTTSGIGFFLQRDNLTSGAFLKRCPRKIDLLLRCPFPLAEQRVEPVTNRLRFTSPTTTSMSDEAPKRRR
jgi:hypothetical protein